MRYAGFTVRLAAVLIDSIAFLPMILLYFWVESHSRTGTMLLVMPYHLFYAAFCIAFLGKYGQTPGKMVMKIVVVHEDGTPIGYGDALLRYSVDATFGLFIGAGMLIAVVHTGPEAFNGHQTWTQRRQLLDANYPLFASVSETLSTLWVYSELAVLLFNRKKRALHDFIAGTVVVHAQKA